MESTHPLPILQNGDPLLREVSKPVPDELFGSDELKKILAQMAATLDEQSDGVALAAPQVGILYRIFIVRYDRIRPPEETANPGQEQEQEQTEAGAPQASPASPAPCAPELGIFINPHFTNSSRRRVEVDEGCLSVRGLYGSTLRHERASIRAQDENGKPFERGGGGLLAQAYQHEVDHLDGILFIDHATHVVEARKDPETGEVREIPIETADETTF